MTIRVQEALIIYLRVAWATKYREDSQYQLPRPAGRFQLRAPLPPPFRYPQDQRIK